MGATYYDAPDDRRNQNLSFDTPLREGDKYFYHDDGQVAWGGSYLQLEVDKYNYSAFVNVSAALKAGTAPSITSDPQVTLDGTTYDDPVTYEVNSLGQFEKAWTETHGRRTANHPGLQTLHHKLGTFEQRHHQGGGSYSIDEWTSAYTNLAT